MQVAMTATHIVLRTRGIFIAGSARSVAPGSLAMAASGEAEALEARTGITTLIFDIDDTLYDVGNGLTAHRNGLSVCEMMVTQLGFSDASAAKELRDEYFQKYHSTAKALTMAEAEGRLPSGARFSTEMLSEWWATTLEFDSFLQPDAAFIADLKSSLLKLVAFSNAPRKYALKVLDALGLRAVFADDHIFAVDDVLPACKPERAAFDRVLEKIGARADECVMVEDSMKNIRVAKALGMRTVLVCGASPGQTDAVAGEATKPGDSPCPTDAAVDAVIRTCGEMRTALPCLWETPPHFQ